MISCEQCQQKLVAIYDNENCKGDVELTNDHLKDCPACREFREDMVSIRKQFISAAVPCSSDAAKKHLIQTVREDSLRRENRLVDNRSKNQPLLLRFPRLAWAAGLAALFLIIVSWLACYTLSREVSDLRGRLEDSRQELANARHDLTVAQSTKQREEDRQKEQKAISEPRIRVKKLERQEQQGISPQMAWLSESPYYRPERPGGL